MLKVLLRQAVELLSSSVNKEQVAALSAPTAAAYDPKQRYAAQSDLIAVLERALFPFRRASEMLRFIMFTSMASPVLDESGVAYYADPRGIKSIGGREIAISEGLFANQALPVVIATLKNALRTPDTHPAFSPDLMAGLLLACLDLMAEGYKPLGEKYRRDPTDSGKRLFLHHYFLAYQAQGLSPAMQVLAKLAFHYLNLHLRMQVADREVYKNFVNEALTVNSRLVGDPSQIPVCLPDIYARLRALLTDPALAEVSDETLRIMHDPLSVMRVRVLQLQSPGAPVQLQDLQIGDLPQADRKRLILKLLPAVEALSLLGRYIGEPFGDLTVGGVKFCETVEDGTKTNRVSLLPQSSLPQSSSNSTTSASSMSAEGTATAITDRAPRCFTGSLSEESYQRCLQLSIGATATPVDCQRAMGQLDLFLRSGYRPRP